MTLQAAAGLQQGGHTLEAVDVSQDHKPKDPREERRINACGGRVDRLVASECPGLREVQRGGHQCMRRLYKVPQASEGRVRASRGVVREASVPVAECGLPR